MNVLAVIYKQYLLKLYWLTFGDVEKLYVELVAFLDPVLFPTGLNDCVHLSSDDGGTTSITSCLTHPITQLGTYFRNPFFRGQPLLFAEGERLERKMRVDEQNVAKTGIEPATQGFSVLCSTN
jgi:hypothetical protein